MSAIDKLKNAAEQGQGKAKEKTGEATGNDRLRAEGKADQVSGNVKQAGEKVRDIFR